MAIVVESARKCEFADEDHYLEAAVLPVAVVEAADAVSLDGLAGDYARRLFGEAQDSRTRWLLDWWMHCRFGERPNGAMFAPEASFDRELLAALETIRDVEHPSDVPPLLGIRHRRAFNEVVSKVADEIHHEQGKARVQGATWEYVEEWYRPALEDLLAGRAADAPSRTIAELRSLMDTISVRRGSEIWRKIERDWMNLDELVQEAVRLSRLPAHRYRGAVPERLDLSRMMPSTSARSSLERLILRDLDLEPVEPRDLLVEIVSGSISTTPENDEWLGSMTRSITDSERRLPQRVRAVHERIRAVVKEASRLERSSIDASFVLLQLDDGQVSAAEETVAGLRSERSREDRRRSLSSELGKLVATATATSGDDIMREEFELVQADLDDGALDDAQRRIQELREELSAQLDADRVVRASSAIRRLEELGGRPDERDRTLVDAAIADGGTIEEDLVERLVDAVDQAESAVMSRTAERLRVCTERLGTEQDLLGARVVDEMTQALQAARDAIDAGDVVNADRYSRRAAGLLEQAVPKAWSEADGEVALVQHIRDYASGRLGFSQHDIDRLYVSLKTKKFAILSGLTGSGKTTIARLFAEAIGATPGNGRFVRIAVRPNWVDETDVLGYVNPTSGRFEPGWLATLIQTCHRSPDLPVFCLLDEMNLAPVEYYLADYLSALEEAGAGADSTEVQLYSPGAAPVNAHEWPSALPFPDNLFLIGTVNVDESTRPLSDRVLDRANVIQLNVEVGTRHHDDTADEVLEARWQVRMRDWRSVCVTRADDRYHEFLVSAAEILVRDLRLGLGVRAHIEIERFISNAASVMERERALDAALIQRLLPKVKGFKRDLAAGLENLKELLSDEGASQCVRVLDDWLDASLGDDSYIDGTNARVGLVTGG